ncbi:MAG: hydroxyacylglutathione hydrolase [Chlamydiales bacterium]|nr:hydroxyacylglutathione hydrolase [Chlamydiales bacterium]
MKALLSCIALLAFSYCHAVHVKVVALPVLADNYAYVIQYDGKAVVVDPGEAGPVGYYLQQEKLKLTYILNTHHHSDHVDGNADLKQWSGCKVLGPADWRIPCLDSPVREDCDLDLDGLVVKVLFVPGHTATHVAFYLPEQGAVFTGDVLFSAGCGRIFEGTTEQMIESLDKLAALPDSTHVYFGHEYTQKNIQWAADTEPRNEAIAIRLAEVKQLRRQNLPTTPSSIGLEKETNPFLRLRNPAFKRMVQCQGSPTEVFERVIALKCKAR